MLIEKNMFNTIIDPDVLINLFSVCLGLNIPNEYKLCCIHQIQDLEMLYFDIFMNKSKIHHMRNYVLGKSIIRISSITILDISYVRLNHTMFTFCSNSNDFTLINCH